MSEKIEAKDVLAEVKGWCVMRESDCRWDDNESELYDLVRAINEFRIRMNKMGKTRYDFEVDDSGLLVVVAVTERRM